MLGASWGTRAAEHAVELPCDALLPHPGVCLHRAISIAAPAPVVYRWLCQLKVAPYSYDMLDNLGRRSPRTLTAGAEQLERGQRFMTLFSLSSFAPAEQITLIARRTAVTYATSEHAGHTRLLVRVLFELPGPRRLAALAAPALALGDLVMMRKQLLTLKALAESTAAAGPLKSHRH